VQEDKRLSHHPSHWILGPGLGRFIGDL
jgi:hypothetical protein